LASITVDLLDHGPTVQIHITIESANKQTPAGLLDGIGLGFSPEELFKPTSYNNMYQSLVISREFLNIVGSQLAHKLGQREVPEIQLPYEAGFTS